jgi:hypothetical protein
VPWKRVQGYRIDLDRVELVYQQPGDEKSVTVTMITGATVNLSGEDAAQFLRSFDAYRAVQEIADGGDPGPESHLIGRSPKGPIYGQGRTLVEPDAADPAPPPGADGPEDRRGEDGQAGPDESAALGPAPRTRPQSSVAGRFVPAE